MKESTRKWNACFMMGLMLTFVISCQDSDFPKSSLDVNPEGKIHFESESKEEQQLVISTNEAQWDFICHADWVKVSKHLDRLIVSADDNEGLEAREAQIIVVAGGLSKTMPVVQDARGVYFDFEETEFSVPAWSETRTLYLRSNTKEWEAVSDVDWLKVSAEPYLGKIVVEILENKGTEERVGEITLKDNLSNKSTILKFTQDAAMQYFLPFFEWGKHIDDIWELESQRKSTLSIKPSPGNSNQPARPYFEFGTRSALFPTVKYQTVNFGDNFVFKAVLVPKDKLVLETQEFKDFMSGKGFQEIAKVERTDGYRIVYDNNELKIKAILIVSVSGQEIIFIPKVEQPRAMPTVDQFYFFGDELSFLKSMPEDVEKYEAKIGGKRDNWWCQYLTKITEVKTELYHADEPLFSRWYYFYKDNVLSEVRYMFSTLDVGYYGYGELFFITTEFEELLLKNGFKENKALWEPNAGRYTFDNETAGLRLITLKTTWNEKQSFAYHIFELQKK